MAAVSRKGWSDATVAALGVTRDDDGRWCFHTAGGVLRYADDGREPKMIAANGSTRELWPVPEDVAGDVLIVVEGEPDAVSAYELGYAAVALPGAGKVNPNWPERLSAGRTRVVLVCDADSVGRKRMKRMGQQIAALGVEAVMVDPAPEREDGYDVGDMLAELGPEAARSALADAMFFAAPIEPDAEPTAALVRTVRERVALGISPRAVLWLWAPYIALGKLTVLAGAPGQGKSQFTLMLAAMVTRGTLPGDLSGPHDVVILSGEDDPEDTIVPRLLACGADLSRVILVDVREADGSTDMLTFPTEHGLLRSAIERRHVGLVILDPISAFMDAKLSTYRNADVRRALAPLRLMAEEFGLAAVAVSHFNKGGDGDTLARVTDSGAYVQLARTVLMMGPDPDDEDGERGESKILVVAKSNIAPPGDHALTITLATTSVLADNGDHIPTSMATLQGRSHYAAEDLFLSNDDRDELSRARAWVRSQLHEVWKPREDIDRDAQKARLSARTLRRALRQDGRKAKERGVAHGRMYWTAKTTNLAKPPWEEPSKDQLGHALVPRNLATLDDLSPNGEQGGQAGQVADNDGVAKLFEDGPPADVDELAKYRKWRDRRLGERDDDDDS